MKLHLILLGIILIIGLFFRTYKIVERFEFAHDGDLYSWIVKDITVNHHFRLIGQLTSAPGIFIGPIFYYSLIPFFMLTKMDPIGTLIPITILGLLTIFSYYFVLSNIFDKKTGLIAAFLYAVLMVTVNSDRWVVPTVTTSIWAIWYLFILIKITQGQFFVAPLLGVLIGLIWDIHIALIPSLIAIPVALFLSKKIPSPKQIGLFFLSFIITSLPLIIFELRHHFQQLIGILQNFISPHEGTRGLNKFIQVLGMITKNTNSLFFAPQSFKFTENIIFVILILFLPLIVMKKRRVLFPLYGWILGMIVFFSLSSSLISEYYFSSLNVIFITFISIFLSFLIKINRIFLIVISSILILVLFKNGQFLITQSYYNKGYLERKAIVDYINQDASQKGFPCIGISYITAPGENVGFRYFFYLKNTHLIHPSTEVPVYNIVIPDELSLGEVRQKFGHIGIIPPAKIPSKEIVEKSCQTPNTNLTDSVFGYVE